MATYLQGVQDTVQSIRPPDPQLQFDAQLLATRQSKYDQSHAKLSKMYGTILNSGLTREDNIAAREEFFKLIESDLHKIAGMDLSKDSNVSKAQNVFKQIYENDFLVKDMVWTKNYQTELQRAEDFRNCKNSEQCGGEYWEDGVKFMNYKREEFKNASQGESLGFENVRYIPYNNMMEQAMKDLKESGLNIKLDQKDGKYIITTQNGELLKTPMTQLFQGLYTKNPDFHDMYKVMAYNGRKDAIREMVASGEYESEEAAGVAYVKNQYDDVKARMDKFILDSKGDRQMLQDKYNAYQLDLAEGRLNESEIAEMQAIEISLRASDQLDTYLKRYEFAQKNMNRQTNMNILFDSMDEMESGALLLDDIDKSVDALKFKDYSVEMDADKFELEQVKFENQVKLEGIKQAGRERLEYLKASLDTGKTEDQLKALEYHNNYEAARLKKSLTKPGTTVRAKLTEAGVSADVISASGIQDDMTWQEVDARMKTYYNETINSAESSNYSLVKRQVDDARIAAINNIKNMNNDALQYVRAGGDVNNVELDFSSEAFGMDALNAMGEDNFNLFDGIGKWKRYAELNWGRSDADRAKVYVYGGNMITRDKNPDANGNYPWYAIYQDKDGKPKYKTISYSNTVKDKSLLKEATDLDVPPLLQ